MSQLKEMYIIMEHQHMFQEINTQSPIAIVDKKEDAIKAVEASTIRNSKLWVLNEGVEYSYSYIKIALNEIPETCIVPSDKEVKDILNKYQEMCFGNMM